MYMVAFKARNGYYVESYRLFTTLAAAHTHATSPAVRKDYYGQFGVIWEIDVVQPGSKKPPRLIKDVGLKKAGLI